MSQSFAFFKKIEVWGFNIDPRKALSYLLKHELELLLAMSPTSQRQYPEKMQQTGGKVSREQKSVFSVLVPIVPMGSSSGPFLRFPR